MRRYVIEISARAHKSHSGTFIGNITVASEEVSQVVTRAPWSDTVIGRMR